MHEKQLIQLNTTRANIMSNPFKYGDIAYQDLQLVNRQTMSQQGINPTAWLDIAAALQLIPITAGECKRVCSFLPIVFSPIDKPMPIAITSFTPGKNPLFVDGQWQEHTYIPAAIRRYPFALADLDKEGKRLLYVDAKTLNANNTSKLFDDKGENTQLLEQAIKHCRNFDIEIHQTIDMVKLIDDIGLFKETQLIITTKDGTEKKTSPFKIIDIEKLNQLSDSDILRLQKTQALAMIYAHFISMNQIEAITRQSLHIENERTYQTGATADK